MNARYMGPAVLPPAAEVRKRVEAHLESLPAWDQKPSGRAGSVQKKEQAKPRKRRRRS